MRQASLRNSFQSCYIEHLVFFRVFPNGTLSISAATADNEGNYLCKADNGVGEAISKLAHVGINGEWNMG